MVNEEQPPGEALDAIKNKSSQVDALQNQLGNILSGVEKSLAVTCESIMGKMKQLEDKIQDMEKRCTELAKDAEQTLKEADKMEPKSEDETSTTTPSVAGESATATATMPEEVKDDEASKQ